MRNALVFPSLFLTASFLLAAPPVITFGPYAIKKTHSTATIYWETDVNGTKRLEYRVAGSADPWRVNQFATTYGRGFEKVHGWMMSGLAPGTTYEYRACSANVTTTFSEGVNATCSSLRTVTTDAVIGGHPVDPIAPNESWSIGIHTPPVVTNTIEWDPSVPSSPGRTLTLGSNCKTAAGQTLAFVLTQLKSLPANSDNYEIRIHPAAVCPGTYIFEGRASHKGWVTVRSGATEAQLPPAGVRVTRDWLPNMPTIRANSFFGFTLAISQLNSICTEGNQFWMHNLAAGYPMSICGAGGVVQPAIPITGYSPGGGNGQGTLTTGSAHGYADGHWVEVLSSGLTGGIDGAGNLHEIRVVNSTTIRILNWVPGGTWSGTGTVRRIGSWRSVAGLGILSTGSGPPVGSCTEGNWYQNTSIATRAESGYFCSGGSWQPVQAKGLGTAWDFAAIRVGTTSVGASRWRFIGLNIDKTPWYTNPPSYLNNFPQSQGGSAALASISDLSSDIVFDRCIVDGLGYPQRAAFGFAYFDGTRVALINSRVERFQRWLKAAISGNWEAFGVNITTGPGPGLIENNYIDTVGINLFWSEGGLAGTNPSDYVIRRNYVTKSTRYLNGHPDNPDNLMVYNRHPIEWKRGERMKVIGNIFDTNWAGSGDANDGGFVAISPVSAGVVTSGTSRNNFLITSAVNNAITVSGHVFDWKWVLAAPTLVIKISGTSAHDGAYPIQSVSGSVITIIGGPAATSTVDATSTVQVINSSNNTSDYLFRSNRFSNGSNGGSLMGMHNLSSGPYPTFISSRIKFQNNVWRDIDYRSRANGGWTAAGFANAGGKFTWFMGAYYGIEDLQIINNTVYGIQSSSSINFGLFSDASSSLSGANEGLVLRNNIIMGPASGTWYPISWGGALGTAGLNLFSRREPSSDVVYADNIICCAISSNTVAGNRYPETAADLKLFATTQEKTRRLQQRYDAPASHRGGADFDVMWAEQGLVRNVRSRRLTASSAIISYYAPDSEACTVEYSTSPVWGTGSRLSDGGGNRNRNVTLASLDPRTQYNYRVLCAVEQPSGVLMTQ